MGTGPRTDGRDSRPADLDRCSTDPQTSGALRPRVIDYIVPTKMPRGTRWILGAGNKKRALRGVQQPADMDAPFFDRTEALFALWDMQVREREIPKALETARRLAQDFPANEELRRFIETHEVGTRASN